MTKAALPYRPAFEAGLRLLAKAMRRLGESGQYQPTLVGGAAVELYTAGAVATGDFDLVTVAQPELEAVLVELGFERPAGHGRSLRGFVHPSLPMGVEVVGSSIMGGSADPARRRRFILDEGEVIVIGVEDLIADRMGQAAAVRGGDPVMLAQARLLYVTADPLDETYLDARIRTESLGEYGLDDLAVEG
jgi:hypothetical protein